MILGCASVYKSRTALLGVAISFAVARSLFFLCVFPERREREKKNEQTFSLIHQQQLEEGKLKDINVVVVNDIA